MRTEIRCKVELREDATLASPGRLTGTLLTYGERASDRPEVFDRGAFDMDAITASGGIVHQPAARAGRAHRARCA